MDRDAAKGAADSGPRRPKEAPPAAEVTRGEKEEAGAALASAAAALVSVPRCPVVRWRGICYSRSNKRSRDAAPGQCKGALMPRERAGRFGRYYSRAKKKSFDDLSDDLVVEIFSRLPSLRSLCRLKRASKTWNRIISHPERRHKLPQTLAGFFYTNRYPGRSYLNFTRLAQRGAVFTSFRFLPDYTEIVLLDCCNGLLLYQYSCRDIMGSWYVVCNPATKKWTRLPLPLSCHGGGNARLGFDPAVSCHFHVFKFVKDDDDDIVTGVELFSSQTGGWVYRKSEWSEDVAINNGARTVFFEGFLHFFSDVGESVLAAVDTEGREWTDVPAPEDANSEDGFLQLSQGSLYFAHFYVTHLEVYVFEGKHHILSHSIDASEIFDNYGDDLYNFSWVAMHPDRDVIFFTLGASRRLMSCDMNTEEFKVINRFGEDSVEPYLPCVPLYKELPALHE